MNWSNRELEPPPIRNDTSTTDSTSVFQEKPTKAIIGLGMLIVLSLLLYEVNHLRSEGIGATPPQTMAQQLHTPPQSSP